MSKPDYRNHINTRSLTNAFHSLHNGNTKSALASALRVSYSTQGDRDVVLSIYLVGDHLWVSRFLLNRIAEDFGCKVSVE